MAEKCRVKPECVHLAVQEVGGSMKDMSPWKWGVVHSEQRSWSPSNRRNASQFSQPV